MVKPFQMFATNVLSILIIKARVVCSGLKHLLAAADNNSKGPWSFDVSVPT